MVLGSIWQVPLMHQFIFGLLPLSDSLCEDIAGSGEGKCEEQ